MNHAAYDANGTSQVGEWRLNHVHSINHAEVINASLSNSSAEIDYSALFHLIFSQTFFHRGHFLLVNIVLRLTAGDIYMMYMKIHFF